MLSADFGQTVVKINMVYRQIYNNIIRGEGGGGGGGEQEQSHPVKPCNEWGLYCLHV